MKIASKQITTQNLAPTGEATEGSTCALENLRDEGLLAIQVAGTYTGALTVQGRVTADGGWVSIPVTGMGSAASGDTIASAATGIWRADVAGLNDVRVTALAAVTANVWMRSVERGAPATMGVVATEEVAA
jgi:hypothetical protein